MQRPLDIKNRPRIPIPDEDPYSIAGNGDGSGGSSGSSGFGTSNNVSGVYKMNHFSRIEFNRCSINREGEREKPIDEMKLQSLDQFFLYFDELCLFFFRVNSFGILLFEIESKRFFPYFK